MSPSLLAFEILDPRGRCNRKGLLIIAIVLLALQLVAGALASLGVLQRGGPAMRIAEVTFVLAAFSATSKRLHDLGLSAWWILAGLGGLAAWSVVLALVLVFTVGAAALQPGALGFVIAVVGTMAPAFAASRRSPSSSVLPDDATPTRLPTTNRRLTVTFVSATFWWIWLFANLVSDASSASTRASASVAPSASACRRARSARSSASRARSSFTGRLPLAHADLDVPEACSGDSVTDVAGLAGLALAAVRCPEHHVAPLVADRVA